MPALVPGKRVVDVIAGLRNEIGPEVPRVLDLVVIASDERDAAEERRIAVDDADLAANGGVVVRVQKAVIGANETNAGFVDQTRSERIGPADGCSIGMIEVRAASKASTRGQIREESGVSLVGAAAAKAAENGVRGIEEIVSADIEVVPILDNACGAGVVLKNVVAIAVDGRCAVRFREEFQIGLADRIDARRWNDVGLRAIAHELQAGAWVDDGNGAGKACAGAPRIAGAEQLGKVTLAHQVGGHGGKADLTRLAQAEAFVIAEVKEFVLDDRAAHGAAELVAIEAGCFAGEEKVLGIQIGVAVKPESAAVNRIGAGFEGSDDQGAPGATVFRRSNVGLNAELIDGVRRREKHDGVHKGLVVVNAVQDEIVVLRAETIDGERRTTFLTEAEGLGVVVGAGSGIGTSRNAAGHAWGQSGKLSEVAPI